MRLNVLLPILLILIGVLIYQRGDEIIPAFSTNTASSTEAAADSGGFKDWFMGLIPSLGDSANSEELAETEEADASAGSKTTTKTESTVGSVHTSPSSILSNIKDQVKDLSEDVSALSESGSESPYKGMVTLKTGQAKKTDSNTEYVTLTAANSNSTAINITGWSLKSTVTKKKAYLPEGNRYLSSENDRAKSEILLSAGEQAHVTTGETPLRVSFRENKCTGYLKTEGSFSPSLGNYCPLPGDELLLFGGDNSSNSKCSEFVNKVSRCSEVDDDKLDDGNISGSCEMFIENVLTYEGCVKKHSGDPDYLAEGNWRIYLGEKGEMWRSTDETIELLDASGRVVDTLEY